ncbi:MAG: 5-(carboxyamino)imidazole ribonucleotide synthase [Bacteroidia bacterium]
MKTLFSSAFTLGILGGGQLGKMMLYDTRRLDIRTKVLDPSADCPCAIACNEFVQGDLMDYDTVLAFGRDCDVITIEIEHVNTAALQALKAMGKQVHPDPEGLSIIQDKGIQKQFYLQKGFPTCAAGFYPGISTLENAVREGRQELPFVWKSTRFGYDGKGVKFIKTIDDLAELPQVECIAEAVAPIAVEIAVIAVRNAHDEVRCFPACEMVFHPTANLVETVECPSSCDADLLAKAENLAADLIRQLGICGLLAVEFFVTTDGQLLVNESAPRPHNSGHYTIEACYTSQYEQHLRGILGMPLGDPALKCPAVMLNLVGEADVRGPVLYAGAESVMALDGVYLHVYGKKETRPYRKMGHVTIVRSELIQARQLALKVREQLKVISQ